MSEVTLYGPQDERASALAVGSSPVNAEGGAGVKCVVISSMCVEGDDATISLSHTHSLSLSLSLYLSLSHTHSLSHTLSHTLSLHKPESWRVGRGEVRGDHVDVRGGERRDQHPVPFKPFTLHPTLYTLHPTTHTQHPTPYTLHPIPYTLHTTPYTLHTTHHTGVKCVVITSMCVEGDDETISLIASRVQPGLCPNLTPTFNHIKYSTKFRF